MMRAVAAVATAAVLLSVVCGSRHDGPVTAAESTDADAGMPTVRYIGSSHYEFGVDLGERTAALIAARFSQDAQLAVLEQWLTKTGDSARNVLQQYMDVHQQVFPDYYQELEGIARGSGQPRDRVWLVNLSEELSYFTGNVSVRAPRPDHCSDVMVSNGNVTMGGHNEDSGVETVGRTVQVIAQVGDDPMFYSYCYAGELPTPAFGVNAVGVGFTLNFVQPSTQWVKYGLARNFISRALLAASSLEEAVAVAAVQGQGSGRSVNLFSFNTNQMVNVESAGNVHQLTAPSPSKPLFHANLYMHLKVAQPADEDSSHRMARFKQLPTPTNRSSIIAVLGDTTDPMGPPFFPIYQSGGDGLYTMATAVYDLQRCVVDVVTGNPLTSPTAVLSWTNLCPDKQ